MKKTPAFLLAALLLGIQPAQAFSVRHDFSVQIGPFDASRTNFEYALTPTEYRVESTVKTNGLFDTLYPFRADYATTGKINGDNMETRSYKYKSQSRFTSRSRELVYDRNGKPLYRLSAKTAKRKSRHPARRQKQRHHRPANRFCRTCPPVQPIQVLRFPHGGL